MKAGIMLQVMEEWHDLNIQLNDKKMDSKVPITIGIMLQAKNKKNNILKKRSLTRHSQPTFPGFGSPLLP